ncbi:sensor histidine kinase [Polaromonas sp. YR568]|uniref:sensor histidine kinase n=1 Tax=Polaromonas sp. YR568 TaxID=1855301 RepID=UPI000B82D3C2|nr:sensor histidine kinase [Polaromonas sp. YR568]
MAAALLAVVAAVAALAALDMWSESANHTQLHITKADWQVSDAPGFSAAPATQDSSLLPNAWQTAGLPHALPVALLRQAAAAAPGTTRTTWFRVSSQGLPPTKLPLALYGARVRTDGTVAVYADGRLVHTAQQQGPLWNSPRMPLWVPLEKTADGSAPREILIRLEHTRASQVALSSLWLGPAEALSWRHSWRYWLQLELPAMFSTAFLAVGIFALFVWFKWRHRTAYLLFFVLAATSFLRGLHFYVGFLIANDWFAWLSVNSLFWLVATVHFSIVLLHRHRQPWLTGSLIAVTVLMGLLTLPMNAPLPNTPQVTPLIYAVVALMGVSVSLAGAINAWRRASGEAMLVAMGTALCTVFGAGDWLQQSNFTSPEGWYLGAWTNAISFSIFGALLYRRYVGAIVEVEQVNASLAERLKAREIELEMSHQRLRAVEQRQLLGEERQRMMQDMHDGLGSTLISAIRSVEHGGMSDAKVSQILKDCMDDLKLAIDSMEPVEADLLLLLATLRFRLEPRLEGTGVTLFWEVQELPTLQWLDPSSALHILRIVQESVANILRHTRATEIRVATSVAGDGVQVIISDNGQGFDVEKALEEATGKGLHNQRRRAQMLRGTVAWESGPGGTRFTLWLPKAPTVAHSV